MEPRRTILETLGRKSELETVAAEKRRLKEKWAQNGSPQPVLHSLNEYLLGLLVLSLHLAVSISRHSSEEKKQPYDVLLRVLWEERTTGPDPRGQGGLLEEGSSELCE